MRTGGAVREWWGSLCFSSMASAQDQLRRCRGSETVQKQHCSVKWLKIQTIMVEYAHKFVLQLGLQACLFVQVCLKWWNRYVFMTHVEKVPQSAVSSASFISSNHCQLCTHGTTWRIKLLHLPAHHSPLLLLQKLPTKFGWLCSVTHSHQSKLKRDWEFNLFGKLPDLHEVNDKLFWCKLEASLVSPNMPEKAVLLKIWRSACLRKLRGGQKLLVSLLFLLSYCPLPPNNSFLFQKTCDTNRLRCLQC